MIPCRDYLQSLLAYLEGFHERVSPLSNLGATYQRLQQEFEEAWETGQLAGWEDRGIGKANGEHQAPVVDLLAFDTVEELETLGTHPTVPPPSTLGATACTVCCSDSIGGSPGAACRLCFLLHMSPGEAYAPALCVRRAMMLGVSRPVSMLEDMCHAPVC